MFVRPRSRDCSEANLSRLLRPSSVMFVRPRWRLTNVRIRLICSTNALVIAMPSRFRLCISGKSLKKVNPDSEMSVELRSSEINGFTSVLAALMPVPKTWFLA